MAFFLFTCIDQETGIDGTFGAGGIVLAGFYAPEVVPGNDGHSSFSWDMKISSCVFDSPIVASGN